MAAVSSLVGTLFLLVVACAVGVFATSNDPMDLVNVFVGTGGVGYGEGSNPPGAQVPFGMARLSPDTRGFGDIGFPFNHFGGYNYGDTVISYFSHLHMVGAGAADYGSLGVMPAPTLPTPLTVDTLNHYHLAFDHDNETGSPGYYSALLRPPPTVSTASVLAELTATAHSGWHRYSYSDLREDQHVYVFVDLSHSIPTGTVKNSTVTVDTDTGVVSGWIHNSGPMSGRFGGYNLSFSLQFNETFSSYTMWRDTDLLPSATTTTTTAGANVGIIFEFATTGGAFGVEVSAGLSMISIEQAAKNVEMESNGTAVSTKFQSILDTAVDTWYTALSVVEVTDTDTTASPPSEDLAIFWTAVYHTFLSPTNFTEAGGQYLGFDFAVHTSPPGTSYFSDMSIWDVHRSQYPWLGLVRPDVLDDIVRSMLFMAEQGGDLPKWALAMGDTGSMTGQHALVIIAQAYLNYGRLSFNASYAYEMMRFDATNGPPNATHDGVDDVSFWSSHGYVPLEASHRSCSETLEYAYDNWALANMAAAMNFTSDAALFYNRSQNFLTQWNAQEMIFCPRYQNGTMDCPELVEWTNPFDPRYTEGDAWQYRFWAHQDPVAVMNLYDSAGGNGTFIKTLSAIFELEDWNATNLLPSGYYWSGNEPVLFIPWMFAFGGRPDLTQYWTRKIVEYKYPLTPAGIPGNDDYGTMSAWAALALLGVYPQSGSSTWVLGAPRFATTVIHRPDGDITIKSFNATHRNVYVQNTTIDGVAWNEPTLNWNQLDGATLTFVMGEEPPLPPA